MYACVDLSASAARLSRPQTDNAVVAMDVDDDDDDEEDNVYLLVDYCRHSNIQCNNADMASNLST